MAVAAATFLLTAFSFAEGYINANDLEQGDVTAEKKEEDGFVLLATPEKAMVVQKSDKMKAGDDTFTQRISTKGSGKATERAITFPAKAGETIKVVCASSGNSGSRPLHIVNTDTGEELKSVAAASYKEGKPTVDSVKAPADGTYAVYSTGGGMYIYKIEVSK